jgi:hypothetical protein
MPWGPTGREEAEAQKPREVDSEGGGETSGMERSWIPKVQKVEARNREGE